MIGWGSFSSTFSLQVRRATAIFTQCKCYFSGYRALSEKWIPSFRWTPMTPRRCWQRIVRWWRRRGSPSVHKNSLGESRFFSAISTSSNVVVLRSSSPSLCSSAVALIPGLQPKLGGWEEEGQRGFQRQIMYEHFLLTTRLPIVNQSILFYCLNVAAAFECRNEDKPKILWTRRARTWCWSPQSVWGMPDHLSTCRPWSQ